MTRDRPDSCAPRCSVIASSRLEPLEPRCLFSGAPTYLLPVGDSITYGIDSLSTAGYRGPLEDLIDVSNLANGANVRYTGTLDNLPGEDPFTGVTYREHFGLPGARGDTLDDDLGDNNGAGPDAFDLLDAAGQTPDALLLHIGTNTINAGGGDDFNAAQDLDELLGYLRSNPDLPTSVPILVAQIIPKADKFDTTGATDGRIEVTNVAEYNYNAFNSVTAVTAAYANIVLVDFYSIPAASLTSLSAAELAQVNVDTDGYVDWVLNYDESNPLDAGNLGAVTGYNTALLEDGIHPTTLGYKVMADVWYSALVAQGLTAAQPPDPTPTPVVDFNSDGQTDLVWRNQVDGRNTIWYMDGETVLGQKSIRRLANTDWEISGIADFDQDGDLDLWFKNQVSGRNTVWLLDANNDFESSVVVAEAGPLWRVGGIGDFDSDGSQDVFWEKTDGTRSIWYLGGAQGVTRIATASPQGLSASDFRVTAVADHDGDGDPDVIYRQLNSSTTTVALMDDALLTGTDSLPDRGSAFHLAQVGDFNADGDLDFVWRKPGTSQNQLWTYVSGDGDDAADYDIRGMTSVGTDWQLPGTGIWYA